MSDKSGSSGAALSLPKGGGALHGIGEKFSPDLHTGTGNFTVPLALPPGRNGFQPQLSLVYSSGNGNGPFGLGWSLSIPGVSRKTSDCVPRYDDSQDTFLLSGAEDLVPVLGQGQAITRYRPRTEGLFARIERHRDAGDDHWEVRTKDGHVSHYGTPASAGVDPAALADPANRLKVFCWKLSRTADTFGNRIEYEYERDLGDEGPRHFDQLYLKRIRYVDYTENGQTKFLISVIFVYENAERPDPFSEYRAGFEIRTRRRCARIETWTHAGADRLVRTCNLTYLDQRADLALPNARNGVSLLSQIRVVGHDGELTEELPPLELDYARFEPEARMFSRVQGADLPGRSLSNRDLELVDLFGNGLPDVLEMNGSVRYWRNLGAGRFDRPREMTSAPAGFNLAAEGVQLLDGDGDGRTDLMVVGQEMAGYFPLQFDGLWDQRSFQRYRQAPSFDLEDPEVRLLDLDGDGVTDALRSGTRLECFFNDAEEGWTSTRLVERKAIEAFPNVDFSDPRVKLGDLSGDGLQDIVLVYDGNVEYWPNLGYGNWGKRVAMRHSPRFPHGYDPKRILIGDVDGDGVADLVYVDDATVTLWINQSGNAWGPPTEIRGTPRISDLDAVRLVDLNGTGVSGILWSADADGRSRTNMFFLDFTGGTKPYLLSETDNHMGALTRVQYAPSTTFYLQDEKRRETRWKTPLPFPVQVVASVEVIDAISGGRLTTQYSYHHGYWDGAEREFRGFGRVDQRDTESFADFNPRSLHSGRAFEPMTAEAFSPPLETRTWFHQGPIGDEFGEWGEADYTAEYWPDDPQVLQRPPTMSDMLKNLPRRARRDALRALRGTILRTELYALDGTQRQERPYTVSESLYGVREEAPPVAGEGERPRIFFPHALAQRATQWERGGDPMTRFTFSDDYNAYGQPRIQTDIAVPRGRDFRVPAAADEPYLATHVVTDFAHRDDGQHYLVGRQASTTSYELLNDGSPDVFALHASIVGGTASRQIIGQTLSFYDGPAFVGLPFGQLGDHGVLSRTENLVLTEAILQQAYRSGTAVQTPPEIPPYLAPVADPTWPSEYPQEFRDLLAPLAGYVFQPGGTDSPYARGYFAAAERRRYDCQEDAGGQPRGLLKASRDPLGHEITIAYDAFSLLPVETTGPTALSTSASYDYRVLQPREITDPNGNRTRAAFTPLGLVSGIVVMGKVGENVGDAPDAPSARMVYDFLAFSQRQQPVSVRTIRRMHHTNDTDVPLPERDETIETVEYTDGFGRLLQTRTQAEEVGFGDATFGDAGLPLDLSALIGAAVGRQPDPHASPRVVVSGWQIYDNKGRVVEKYEPFFSRDWAYAPPAEAQLGHRATIVYDPRSRVIRTVNPDGSEQRVVFGVPDDLRDPERFAPTPWETFTYDANDNAGRTHPNASAGYQQHWNTPAGTTLDALGRIIAGVTRNGPDPASDWFTTRSNYDIRGNLLTVTDALGRVAFQHVYDLANRPLRVESIDAGLRRTILDAAGNPVEARDSKGALLLRGHDALNRPARLWARDGAGQALTLGERLVYGDGADSGIEPKQAAALNLLGRPLRHYDEAGLLSFDAYDFKGNLFEKTRRVISDAALMSVFDPAPKDWVVAAFRVDWHPPAGITLDRHASGLLDAQPYRTTAAYDALNRVRIMHYPDDVKGQRKTLRPHYNRAGALERVELDGATFVESIAYNARGQRTLIAYGNGVMTRHAYDSQTFRLRRLRTESYIQPDALAYRPTGIVLQDFAYEHDLAGNVALIRDRAPGCGIPNTALGADTLDRAFGHDPLYRLLSATGRECDLPPSEPWDDAPRSTDLTRARGWTEQYHYDAAGNMTRLQHHADGGGFVRDLALVPGSNRLAAMTVGKSVFDHNHDPNGNLLGEATSRHFEWNHSDRMRVYRTQTDNAEPSVHAHYLYDANGQRVKKLVRKQGGQFATTIYVDGSFEHHRVVQKGTTLENNTLHVLDGQSRIALIRVGAPFPDDVTPAVQFHFSDHLGSSHIVADDTGAFINREEYTPYGETSFGSFARKRYRFAGKERDEESGLNYHGARYYAPWLVRWVSCDPAGTIDGTNLYVYVRDNPVNWIDPNGKFASPDRIAGKKDLEKQFDANKEKFKDFIDSRVKDETAKKFITLLGDPWSSPFIPQYAKLWFLGQTVFFPGGKDDGGNRFVFTTAKAWIDVGHFFSSAAIAQYARAEFPDLTQDQAAKIAYAAMYALELHQLGTRSMGDTADWKEIHQFIKDNYPNAPDALKEGGWGWDPARMQEMGWATSAFTYEDLPTNWLGAQFGAGLKPGQDPFAEAIKFFEKIGIVDPGKKLSSGEMIIDALKKDLEERNKPILDPTVRTRADMEKYPNSYNFTSIPH